MFMVKKAKCDWSEKDWEEWGERFGERMENWGKGFGRGMDCKFGCGHGSGIGGLIFGLFILTWGAIWLGNDLGWWQLEFPFWPILIISIGLAVLLGEIKKAFR